MSEKKPLLQGHTDSLDESASDEVTTKLGGQIQHGVLVIKVSWAATCAFQQFDILTCVDSDEPLQPPFKGLVKLQKMFFKLLLIEKPVMRETECLNPHQKIQNSYQVMKVSKFN